MLEFYEAYSNYRDLMDLNEQLFAEVAKNITGSTIVKYGDVELNFGKMERLSMREAIGKYWPAEAGAAPTSATWRLPGGPRAADGALQRLGEEDRCAVCRGEGHALATANGRACCFETMAEHQLGPADHSLRLSDRHFSAVEAKAG